MAGEVEAPEGRRRRNLASAPPADFSAIVPVNLKTSGVQQAAKADKIVFTSLTPWPGECLRAEGRFMEGEIEPRAAIFIGPEFGTTSRPDLTAAAREATDARFDVLIAAAFNFEAHASDLVKLGPLPILKAKINPDMHMAGELKNTGEGNLFIVFGEPDIDIEALAGDQIQVRVKGGGRVRPQHRRHPRRARLPALPLGPNQRSYAFWTTVARSDGRDEPSRGNISFSRDAPQPSRKSSRRLGGCRRHGM